MTDTQAIARIAQARRDAVAAWNGLSENEKTLANWKEIFMDDYINGAELFALQHCPGGDPSAPNAPDPPDV